MKRMINEKNKGKEIFKRNYLAFFRGAFLGLCIAILITIGEVETVAANTGTSIVCIKTTSQVGM